MTSPHGPQPSHPRASSRATSPVTSRVTGSAAARLAGPTVAALAAAVVLAGCGNPSDEAGSPMVDHSTTSSGTATASEPATAPPSPAGTSPTGTASGPAPTGTRAGGPHNQADVTFAAGMVPHHQQAVVMADMALRHGGTDDFVKLATGQNPAARKLAGSIITSQTA